MSGRLVKDINTNDSASPNELIDIEGILYFVAESGASGGAGGGSGEGHDSGST